MNCFLKDRDIVTCAAYQQKVVVLWFSTEVFEYGLLPVPLHMIPVVNHAMTDGKMQSIRLGIGKGVISNMKVKVLYSTFRS